MAQGNQALKACLQHATEDSFTITDKQGRNFWHLLFLRRTEDEVAMALGEQRVASASSGKFDTDDLHRTPLHYACMRTGDWSECSQFTNTFVNELDADRINKQDILGRTASHYAAFIGNQKSLDFLQEKEADDTIRDKFGKTAGEYMTARHMFTMKLAFLRLIKTSNFIAGNARRISVCVAQCFRESCHDLASFPQALVNTIRDLRSCGDTDVQNIYRGCRIDYADDQPLSAMESLHNAQVPMTATESAQRAMTMFAAIQERMNEAMHHLASEISAQDSRFICEVFPVGSAREGTRIGCCDEFDYNLVLTDLSGICKVGYSPESPPGFVQLRALTSEYDEELFNSNGTLNTRIVKFRFEALVKRVLSSSEFCEATGLEFIDQFKADALPGGTVSTKLHTCIKLAFTQPVNGYHVLHTISVDIVPALRINGWWPDDARKRDFCRPGECLIVFTQPQDKYPWIGWTEPHGFVSFAQAESRRLHECPLVVKAAYMVVKRMSKYFCHYDFFPSHVIKTALLWCLDENRFTHLAQLTSSNDEVIDDELLLLVKNILKRLLCFAAQDYVPSYFMPKCHQPVWLQERHLKQFHMRLYQHGLTYKDLLSLNEQKSLDQMLLHIKDMFVFSHIVYWSMLSDNDELKLFVPSTINPFCENSYDPDFTPER